MTEKEQFREIILCRKSFPYFCKKYVKIYHQIRGIVPFELYQFQERVVSEYQNHRFNIIRKFRQGGISTVTAVYCLWRCCFFVDQSAFVISITDREAINFHKIVTTAYESLPEWLAPRSIAKNQHELVLDSGGSIICLTPKAGRSFAKGLVVIDEAAFIPEMEDAWGRIYPVVSTGGQVIVVSTVNGIGNWYHKTWIEAENQTNRFNRIRLNYTEHPDYNKPEWVEETKAQLGEKKWKQEVLGEFLGSANTYLRAEVIQSYIDSAKFPIECKLEKEALRIWEQPIPGHLYVLGGDAAEGLGEESDFSSIEVIDLHTLRQAAEFYSQDYPPHKFSQIVALLGRKYNTACVVLENNGMGAAVLSDLRDDIGYENLYYHNKNRRIGFSSATRSRFQIQENLFHVLSNHLCDIKSIRFANELLTWMFDPNSRRADHLKGYPGGL